MTDHIVTYQEAYRVIDWLDHIGAVSESAAEFLRRGVTQHQQEAKKRADEPVNWRSVQP